MSNAYAQKLAAMVATVAPHGITVEAPENWPGVIFYYHANNHRGKIDLYSVNVEPVDNRRTPTDADRDTVLRLMYHHALSASRDQRIKPEFRAMAGGAAAVLEGVTA